MTENGLHQVLVAIARLEEQMRGIDRRMGEMDASRHRARAEMDVKLSVLEGRVTKHGEERRAAMKEVQSDVADIKADLAGGTATRRFIVSAVGVGAGAATVIGVLAGLLSH